MELDLEEIDMAELLEEIAEDARAAAAANNGNEFSLRRFRLNLGVALCDAGQIPEYGRAIARQCREIHPERQGRDHCRSRRPAKDGDELVVDVIDTGIGIAPDQITDLFEKFTVADDSSTSKYGGTGLGLALSQKLCKLMGGEISVESRLGKGSRFTIRMPLVGGPPQEPTRMPPRRLCRRSSDYSLDADRGSPPCLRSCLSKTTR